LVQAWLAGVLFSDVWVGTEGQARQWPFCLP
jgi:hypothetical protein